MTRFKIVVAAGCLAALGAIAASVWIGASVREDTVVAHPYEDGLRQDAERHARAAVGLAVAIPAVPDAGTSPLAFELRDRTGGPVDDATVAVEVSRPATSRGERSAAARSLGGGRWTADVAFPEPGPWDVRFDVVRGKDRVRLERRVGVRARCDLGSGPCTARLDDGAEVTLDLAPRPIRTMQELAVRADVKWPSRPALAAVSTASPVEVAVAFSMVDMDMGPNRVVLAPAIGGSAARLEGTAVLVRCPSGRREWLAEVTVQNGGVAGTARFPLTLPEGAR